ncbi:TPR repeat-containing protein [Palleronia salina]|uniref:TPR repeat-containing protein n=1 Tax=Palleronia salina TaxID=313368 RepID=A0A1M6H2T8_9RHOB|nr:tetratricopeptide repeat protein [Palleronia salina]SHJ16517.1 TPR repeat-containing protein [Palleronia salina]
MLGLSHPVARLHLIGPLSLTDADGATRTPRGQKAGALLALLALAPRRQRTRVWLRDKLWSDSSDRNASTSLRQTIFELRRDLGDLFDQILEVDRHTLGLRTGALWIDVHAVEEDPSTLSSARLSEEVDLLEGIDIGDPEFEDWLLMERQGWYETRERLAERAARSPATVPTPKSTPPATPAMPQAGRISLGLMPHIQQGCDDQTAFVADHLIESVVRNLGELHPIAVYDFRDAGGPSDRLIGAGDTEYFLRVRTLQVHGSLTLTFFFHLAETMTLAWSQSIQADRSEVLTPDSQILAGFVTQNADRLSREIERRRPAPAQQGASTLLTGYTALNMMFRLDRNALHNAETLLAGAQDSQGGVLMPALSAYATSFRVGENLGSLAKTGEDETRAIVADVLRDSPFNAIALACLGHAVGYVLRDHEQARGLLERALQLNPHQAFVWDHYALNRLYAGDYATAIESARRAVSIGAYSPLSYSYDTTLAMAATMAGQHGQAIAASRAALSKQPRFAAAMRYLVVNLSKTDRADEARQVYDGLLLRDPDFTDPAVQKARFRISQSDREDDLIAAVRRISG